MITTPRIRAGLFSVIAFSCVFISAYSLTRNANASVVGLWRFDEASGSVLDSSGNGNNGEFVGVNSSRIVSMPGFGSAAHFFNDFTTSSYVQIPGDFSLVVGDTAGQPWTIALWANEYDDGFGDYSANYGTMLHYRRTLSDQVPYPSIGDTNDSEYGYTMQSGAIGDDQAYVWHGTNPNWRHGTSGSYSPSENFNTWTHYATVYDGENLSYYVNGIERVSIPIGSDSISYDGFSGALQIGAAPGFSPDRNWNGALDDVAIFNEALSSSDLATIMNGNFAPFINPLPQPAKAAWSNSTFGEWNSKPSWDPLVVPNSTGITVVFGDQVLANTTVVNNAPVTVKGVEFNHTLKYAIAGNGSITIDAGGTGNGSIQVLNGGGDVAHEFQQPVLLASDTSVSVAASTILEFDYPLELGTSTMTISGPGLVNINSRATTGNTGTLINSGNLGGSGTVTGDLQNLSTGTLLVNISGDGPLDASELKVLGTATLDGTLSISLGNSFAPTAGAAFTVLTADSIVDNGLVLAGDAIGFSYSIVGGTELVLLYEASNGTPGDFDNDGDVDGRDFLIWQRGGSPSPLSSTDLANWQTNYGFGTLSSSVISVPEPMSASLMLTSTFLVTVALRLRRPSPVSSAVCLGIKTGLASGEVHAKPSIRWFTLAISLLCCTTITRLSATELIFSFDYCGSGASPGSCIPAVDGYTLIDEYGDRVTGPSQLNVPSDDFGGTDWYNLYYGESGEGFTPNVVVDYWAPTSPPPITPTFKYWGSQGGLSGSIWPDASQPGPAMWAMTFTADPGVQVQIDSLQVSRSGSSQPADITVSVYTGDDPSNLGSLLWSSGATTINPDTPQTFTPSGSANTLSLVYHFGTQVDPLGPLWSWAIDNVRFSQIGGGIATSAEWQRDGTGTWSNGSNWSPDISPNIVADGNDRTAVFGNATSAPTTVVLDKDITLKTLEFNHTHSYNLAGTGKLTLAADVGSSAINVLDAGGPVSHKLSAELSLDNDTNVVLAEGTTLEVNNRLSLNGFDLIKSGPGTLSINNVVQSGGGDIVVMAGLVSGNGTIGGSVDNLGAVIAPGNSPGALTIQGDYSQSVGGKVVLEIAGTTPGILHDVLNVGGTAWLDGSLEVLFTDGFIPQAGDEFDLFNFADVVGEFSELVLPPRITWDTSRLTTEGKLIVTAIPEPASWFIAVCGLFLTTTAIRRIQ